MDKKDFQKYIDEMKKMSKRAAVPAVAEAVSEPIPTPKRELSDMSGKGYVIVNVTAISELYPVKGARVTVFKGSIDNMEKIAEELTDQSGKTVPILLPTPPLSLALSEAATLPVYAEYNIITEADGFLPTINYNAAVFDGVTSIQNVNLIPKTSFNENASNVFDEENDYDL